MANVALWVAIGKGAVDLFMYIRERRQAKRARVAAKRKPCPPPAPRARGLQ